MRLKRAPGLIHLRVEDGRGPLWWAYEYDRPDMVALLPRKERYNLLLRVWPERYKLVHEKLARTA